MEHFFFERTDSVHWARPRGSLLSQFDSREIKTEQTSRLVTLLYGFQVHPESQKSWWGQVYLFGGTGGWSAPLIGIFICQNLVETSPKVPLHSGGPVLTRAFHVQGAQLSRHLDLELKIDDKLNFSVAPTDSFLRFLSTQCSLQFSSLDFCPVQFRWVFYIILKVQVF